MIWNRCDDRFDDQAYGTHAELAGDLEVLENLCREYGVPVYAGLPPGADTRRRMWSKPFGLVTALKAAGVAIPDSVTDDTGD